MAKFIILMISLILFNPAQVNSRVNSDKAPPKNELDPELKKRIDKIIEGTKNVGAVGQPISDETKKVLDSSTRLHLDRKNPEGQYSTDCKNWKTIDLSKQSEINSTKMYYKTLEGGFPSLIDIKNQTIFSYDGQKLFYTKILSDAVTGLVNSVPIYREIEGKNIQSGLAGVLQGILLVAAESSSSWLLTGSGNTVRLLHMLVDQKSKALENYTSVVCTKEAKCFLVTKTKESEELRLSSNAHMALKDSGIFSVEKLGVFFRMCEAVDTKDFFKDLASEVKSFENACDKSFSANLTQIVQDRVSRICSELKYHILPMMKTYR